MRTERARPQAAAARRRLIADGSAGENSYNHVAFERCGRDSRPRLWSDTIAPCSTGSPAYSYVTKLSTKRAISVGG